jgi:hypothetical protein
MSTGVRAEGDDAVVALVGVDGGAGLTFVLVCRFDSVANRSEIGLVNAKPIISYRITNLITVVNKVDECFDKSLFTIP